jgi:hypothetical protein
MQDIPNAATSALIINNEGTSVPPGKDNNNCNSTATVRRYGE